MRVTGIVLRLVLVVGLAVQVNAAQQAAVQQPVTPHLVKQKNHIKGKRNGGAGACGLQRRTSVRAIPRNVDYLRYQHTAEDHSFRKCLLFVFPQCLGRVRK